MARWLGSKAAPAQATAGPDDARGVPKTLGRRVRRLGVWTMSLLLMASLAAGGLVLVLIGQTLHVPEWVRGRVEARIEQHLNGMQIAFGDVSIVVDKGWRPRVRLLDVVLTGKTGLVLLDLREAEASLAMRPLLRGQVQPKQIALTGAFAALRRDREGAFSLSLGNTNAQVRKAPNLPQLIQRWDKVFETPLLSALTSVELTGMSIRYEDARQTHGWTLDDGRILLSRDADQLRVTSSFAVLGGRDSASSVEVSYSSQLGSSAADVSVLVQDVHTQDIATQSVALAWMNALRAPISGAFRASIDDVGQFGPISATLQIDEGVLQPHDSARPIPFSSARTYFTYAPDQQLLTFNEVSVKSDWVTGVAEGQAYLGGVETGALTEMIGQFTITEMTVNPGEYYETPLTLDRVGADFRLRFDPFQLDLGQMRITDQNRNIRLNGALTADPDGWHVAVDGEADLLDTDRLTTLWPEGAAAKPRKWVDDNLSGGTLKDIDFALRIEPGRKPDIYLDFAYQDATVQFLKTMPPITGAAGQTSLIRGRFVTTASAGIVTPEEGGPLDIAGTSFIIPDVTIKKAAPGIVRLVGSGSVTAVMSMLNRPPLSVLKQTPLPVALAEGHVQITGTLALPLKKKAKFEEFEFHATGEITDVSSSVLVPGHEVTTPALQVKADQTGVIVSGPGAIGAVPVNVSWHQPLGGGRNQASQLSGSVQLSQQLIDTFNIGLPAGTVSGTGQGDFTLDLVPGQPLRLNVSSDLAGVGLRFPALGWSKAQSATGLFELSGTVGAQTTVDRLELRANGLGVIGSVDNNIGGGLDRARFSSVTLGGWLDVKAELVGRGTRPPSLHILGGTLDMRRATFGASTGDAASGQMQVALDRLQVTDTLSLNNFSGLFETQGGLNGPFSGYVNGETAITGELAPLAGRSAVRVRSKDAGGVFRAAGILEQGRDGDFDLTLQPVGDPGNFEGVLRVTNTRVKNAPAIAALLNAVSVVGLLDEMAGQGIQFSEVDARFGMSPSHLTLYQSSAVGPSIGLSMDGTYNVANGTLDMQGVVSPVYLLNGIGSVLTRKGEGVIGFNYNLEGSASSPSVEVNPLSALTPGMFREIFRRQPPTAPAISNEVFSTPEVQEQPKRPSVISRGADR